MRLENDFYSMELNSAFDAVVGPSMWVASVTSVVAWRTAGPVAGIVPSLAACPSVSIISSRPFLRMPGLGLQRKRVA
jgi:hypothetical protein